MAAAAAACIVFGVLVALGLLTASHIASICIAAEHWEAASCSVSGIDLSLQSWLMAEGIVGVGVVLYCFLGTLCLLCGISSDGNIVGILAVGFGGVTLVIVLILAQLFWIAWLVLGIVIIAQVPVECKQNDLALWQMSIAAIVFIGLSVVSACCHSRTARNNND